MKFRSDFVTNSSSSSYTLYIYNWDDVIASSVVDGRGDWEIERCLESAHGFDIGGPGEDAMLAAKNSTDLLRELKRMSFYDDDYEEKLFKRLRHESPRISIGYGFEGYGEYADDYQQYSGYDSRNPKPYKEGVLDKYKSVIFGNYAGEPIKWLVLAEDGDKALLISKQALERKRFHNSFTECGWETSSLRRWLNEDFFSEAFCEKERAAVLKSEPLPGNRVFLLSKDEADQYFPTTEVCICGASKHAEKNGAGTCGYAADGTHACWWWTRTTDKSGKKAYYIRNDGEMSYGAYDVDFGSFAVRPCIWVRLPLESVSESGSSRSRFVVEAENGSILMASAVISEEGDTARGDYDFDAASVEHLDSDLLRSLQTASDNNELMNAAGQLRYSDESYKQTMLDKLREKEPKVCLHYSLTACGEHQKTHIMDVVERVFSDLGLDIAQFRDIVFGEGGSTEKLQKLIAVYGKAITDDGLEELLAASYREERIPGDLEINVFGGKKADITVYGDFSPYWEHEDDEYDDEDY